MINLLVLLLPIFSQASDIPFGEVKYLVGEASGRGGELKVGNKVFKSELITTGKSSTLRILLEDGIALQIGASTTFRLERPENKPTTIELLGGHILSRIKPLTGQADRFELRSRGVSMGVRGTTFFTKQKKDGVFLCVCEGNVLAKWPKGEEAIISKHHDDPKNIYAGKAKSESLADMGHEHSDKDLEELQKLLQ